MGVVRLHHRRRLRRRLHLDLDRQPLVVAPSDPLQVVHPGQRRRRDGVELAGDTVGEAGEVEEEGDAVGPADEGESVESAAGGDECGVAGGHHFLQEGVV